MGFMDKAKKMAEQAQQKLDEAQKQFNAGQQGGGQSGGGPAVEYDKHGRPIPQQPPATAEPPHGDPLTSPQDEAVSSPPPPAAPTPGVPPTGQADPQSEAVTSAPPVPQPGVPPTSQEPPGDAPAPQAPPAQPEADAADEDRNHPSYAPPKLSSGDPLAG